MRTVSLCIMMTSALLNGMGNKSQSLTQARENFLDALTTINVLRAFTKQRKLEIRLNTYTNNIVCDIKAFQPDGAPKTAQQFNQEIQYHLERAEKPLPANTVRAPNGIWITYVDVPPQSLPLTSKGRLMFNKKPVLTSDYTPLNLSDFAGKRITITRVAHEPIIRITMHDWHTDHTVFFNRHTKTSYSTYMEARNVEH